MKKTIEIIVYYLLLLPWCYISNGLLIKCSSFSIFSIERPVGDLTRDINIFLRNVFEFIKREFFVKGWIVLIFLKFNLRKQIYKKLTF